MHDIKLIIVGENKLKLYELNNMKPNYNPNAKGIKAYLILDQFPHTYSNYAETWEPFL